MKRNTYSGVTLDVEFEHYGFVDNKTNPCAVYEIIRVRPDNPETRLVCIAKNSTCAAILCRSLEENTVTL